MYSIYPYIVYIYIYIQYYIVIQHIQHVWEVIGMMSKCYAGKFLKLPQGPLPPVVAEHSWRWP